MESALNQLDVYASPPNQALISRTKRLKINNVLDVGAGTGENLRYLKELHPSIVTTAITCSESEAKKLGIIANNVVVCDLNILTCEENNVFRKLSPAGYDLIILSHVLEHLQNPTAVTQVLSKLLVPGGIMLIAVPNICHWRSRLQIALGNFRYEDSGVFDRSHLRFFSYWTARTILKNCKNLSIIGQWAVGGAVLGPMRRYLPNSIQKWIDDKAIHAKPNLFGYETQILAQKK